MNIANYTFQSPSSQQVQIGKLVQGSNEKDVSKQEQSAVESKTPEQWLAKESQIEPKAKPSIDANYLLDTYA